MDPFLLTEHVINLMNGKERVLEIGTGSGVMAIILASQCQLSDTTITAVEIQSSLYEVAKKNITSNGMQSKIKLIHDDIIKMKSREKGGEFDMVISNPPYQKKNSSRINHDTEKAIAKHEITLDMEQLICCAAYFLKQNGSLHLIYPAGRTRELLYNMKHHKIEISYIRFVHSDTKSHAKLVIVSGIKNSCTKLSILPPIFLK
ncbi:putative SAM-dependent methyltransferase [Desulfamplus magnetovallimortis]|uniref:Putative SAM-dependent methyltransferase n=2 Tax=Desulfamplus magnetovallimortis TaxID=1246637 RepID=A0A1W1H4U5_9BACT|nr:putative SAM-dependent methyltransferase [Desulfamplus magnetovallimortis]